MFQNPIVLTLSGYVYVCGEHIFKMCFDKDVCVSEERNGQEYRNRDSFCVM